MLINRVPPSRASLAVTLLFICPHVSAQTVTLVGQLLTRAATYRRFAPAPVSSKDNRNVFNEAC